jgi:hypothetical protein
LAILFDFLASGFSDSLPMVEHASFLCFIFVEPFEQPIFFEPIWLGTGSDCALFEFFWVDDFLELFQLVDVCLFSF